MPTFVLHEISCAVPGDAVRACVDITVENGRIASIEDCIPGRNLPGSYDGRGKIALPGFYNIHSHIPMTLLRGYGEGLKLEEWLFKKMIPFEALLSDEDCYWGSMLGIAEMLASGTVSFTDMYLHMPGIVKAVQESGSKANLSHGFSSRTPGQQFHDSPAYAGWKVVQEAEAATAGRIVADASIHAEYTIDTESTVRNIADWSRGEALRMHVHLSETRKEHEECKTRRGGMTPIAFFEHCGVFDSPTTAAHCVWAEDADLDILAACGVTVAHCPSSNLKLGSGIARIARMVELGVKVGIGTTGPQVTIISICWRKWPSRPSSRKGQSAIRRVSDRRKCFPWLAGTERSRRAGRIAANWCQGTGLISSYTICMLPICSQYTIPSSTL